MDKNAIKKYAVWARRELIERVSQRALIFGISAKDAGDPNAESVNGHLLSQKEKRQRQALISNIKTKGYEQVMEEVAYTWFNRFAALRFMEVNGYLPSHIRVFTNDAGEFKPQILAEAIHLELDGLDMNKVYELESANKSEELFKYLLIVQCNALNSILPGMFQKIDDYTELLLPDYLLREGSVIDRLISDIPEDNFDVRSENGNGQIEIIGWLYQYYISEKHEEVVDPLHGKVVKKEEVPAATQLFTTDWVVRYLIDNSVGRYWIERNPNSTLADKLTYFVRPKNGEIKYVNETITPQDLSTFDPCVGSGHFLVYAFDVLMHIYMEYGYSEREAAAEIVKNNLYGLDIDGRAAQLAYFAVMMKARQYDRRFFSRGIQPHIFEIMESNIIDHASVEQFCMNDSTLKKDIEALLGALKDAKEYGSILQIPVVDFERINSRFQQIGNEISIYNTYLLGDFHSIIRPAEILSRKYAVVATNPPYLNKYDPMLKEFVIRKYEDYKGDLFSVFMYRNTLFCEPNGFCAFMIPNVWMFISSYEKLRRFILNSKSISTLTLMAKGAFFKEATVDICALAFRNSKSNESGLYINLAKYSGDMDLQQKGFLSVQHEKDDDEFFDVPTTNLQRIEGCPIAFWASEEVIVDFEHKVKVESVSETRIGMATANNDRFMRLWYEVPFDNFGLGIRSREAAQKSGKKWYPYCKGGSYRKWYGNMEYAVNWQNDGYEIQNFKDEKTGRVRSHNYNLDYIFKPGLTFTAISSSNFACRSMECSLFGSGGSGICRIADKNRLPLLGLLNSKIVGYLLSCLSMTMNFEVNTVGRLPYIMAGYETDISLLVEKAIELAKQEWDSYETSWDFAKHPLVNEEADISSSYEKWSMQANCRYEEMRSIEEKINEILIRVYHLEGKISSIIEDKDITLRKANLQDDIVSFISYAVGCMFGRYSIDAPGLVFAGGEWNPSKYVTFLPDKDGIIPICDDEYFEDDIVGRFVKFVEVAFGKETLEENLRFIADALGGKGSSREVIRSYFINDFYAYHVQMYQKRPIYWLFDSGKKNGFKCLVYMHRYQPDTIARIRTDYVHEQQSRYRTAIADFEQRINGASTSERVKLSKQLATLQAQAEEIRVYEEKIHHLADQMIKIDLDDGVKHNYELFRDVLAKIK